MKYYTLLAILFCSLFTASIQASCQEEPEEPQWGLRIKWVKVEVDAYIGLLGGISSFDLVGKGMHSKPGYYLGAVVGIKAQDMYRLELEASYEKANMDLHRSFLTDAKGHIRSYSYMFNNIIDINLPFPIVPYLGCGIGYTHTKSQTTGFLTSWYPIKNSSCHDGFSVQFIVGAKYKLCQDIDVGLDYRCLIRARDGTTDKALKVHKLGICLCRHF